MSSRNEKMTAKTDNRIHSKTMIQKLASSSYYLTQITSFHIARMLLIIVVILATTLITSSPPVRASTLTTSLFRQQQANSESQQHQAALNYLLFSSEKKQQQQQQQSTNKLDDNSNLEELLKDSNHSHISDKVSLQLANSIWTKMHQNVLDFAHKRTELVRPTINKLLEQANISSVCRQSINDIIDHLEKLDDWAMRMYNSFGDFPASGFFEGTHTSMGDYHQCVNLEPNEWIGRPQYCTFKFQPIVPKRPKYHNILATIDKLANFMNETDMFHGLAKKAHYFYYTKLRVATCMPSRCEKNDLQLLGEQIAVNTYLQYQGTTCLKKSNGFNPDGPQIFALTILILLASVSVLATLVHVFNLRSLFATDLPINNSADLTRNQNGRGHLKNNQIVLQQQTLLAPHQQKASILPAPVIQASQGANSVGSTTSSSRSSILSTKIVNTIDVLMHFSLVRNGKKLFDTSTSRRGSNRARPLVGGMKETPIGANDSSTSSQSDSSSVDGQDQSNDISCVHGLRFWTISWIILGHTMQYTEWAGFGRAYQVEENITSFYLHPLLNATFSVDTFFLISGLLTTYVTWTITRGQYWRFNKFAFLISRYLRLMPQVLLVILIFIAFPLMGDGPYWRGLIQKESDNCKRNWWVSALFLQSFYRQDQICNLVTWWLSIEMFYHFVSIIVIIALLHSPRKGILAALTVGGGLTLVSCYLHYVNHYPPNMLPTLLQRYEIWDSIVLKYFWTPYPHAPSYFTGLLLGYALYNRSMSQLSQRQIRFGWLAFSVTYLTILFGTYHWNNNVPYSRIISTTYYNMSQIFWPLATGWAILACAQGNGGWLNDFLSSSVFVPLGRATYMTYLSHMLIVMAYPAKMNLLIEPSYIVFLYIFIANLFLSYALGIFLTLVYESPILHLQKLIVAKMALKFNEEDNNNSSNEKNNNSDGQKVVRVTLYTQQHQQVPTIADDESH